MKALGFHEQRDLRIDQVAEPSSPKGADVVLDIIYCGICGTDVHEDNSGSIILPVTPHPVSGAAVPIIPGHEFSAVVAEVGPEVSAVSPVSPGDRVAILSHLMMPGDYYAQHNLGQFSPNTGLVGLTWHWGGMGQRALVPADNLVRLPNSVTDIQGATLEPTAVAINAIDETRFAAGQTLLNTCVGPIGALTALAARAAGASKITIHEPNKARTAKLEQFAEFTVFSGDSNEVLSAIADETDEGIGVDVAVECAGRVCRSLPGPQPVYRCHEADRARCYCVAEDRQHAGRSC